MKNLKTFEEFLNESDVNEAKLQGNEWKLWVDIEEMINELKSKYKGKVAKGKIKEFILDYASDLNEAKLQGNEWKLWVDIEDMITGLKSKYEGKVAKGKIKEFILDYASDLNESKQDVNELYINEAKKSKSELEDYIDKMESKIWEIQNSNKSWIPNTQSKKDAMIKTFQSKIDKAKKDLEKLK